MTFLRNLALVSCAVVPTFAAGLMLGARFQEGRDQEMLQRSVQLTAEAVGHLIDQTEELGECSRLLKSLNEGGT
jgi:hypothetical protein